MKAWLKGGITGSIIGFILWFILLILLPEPLEFVNIKVIFLSVTFYFLIGALIGLIVENMGLTKKQWFIGGVTGLIFGIPLHLLFINATSRFVALFLIDIIHFFIGKAYYNEPLGIWGVIYRIIYFLMVFVIYFIMGALIGFAVGKIKSKKKKK